ncbi:MAG: hypothetical protein ACOCXQ_03645 [Patescibacteria group bacterium]
MFHTQWAYLFLPFIWIAGLICIGNAVIWIKQYRFQAVVAFLNCCSYFIFTWLILSGDLIAQMFAGIVVSITLGFDWWYQLRTLRTQQPRKPDERIIESVEDGIRFVRDTRSGGITATLAFTVLRGFTLLEPRFLIYLQ